MYFHVFMDQIKLLLLYEGNENKIQKTSKDEIAIIVLYRRKRDIYCCSHMGGGASTPTIIMAVPP